MTFQLVLMEHGPKEGLPRFVMSVDSGEVLDYHVFSKSCQQCLLKKSLFKKDLEKFEEWRVDHINNGDCHVNFEGSSPAMDAEAAIVLWQRSVEKHKMRYRYMVSDGDSKYFSTVDDLRRCERAEN